MLSLVTAFIAAGAGVMVYFWLQPVCDGDHMVSDEAQYIRSAGFYTAFCKAAFARTNDIAKVSGPSYPLLWECNQAWPKSMERMQAGEAVPVPSAWCIVRSTRGDVARLSPQYDNRRQSDLSKK